MPQVDWTLAIGTTLTGLVVVFLVLAFLWFSVTIIGKIIMGMAKPAPAPAPTAAAPKAVASTSNTHKLTPEIVAAITGAIGATTGENFKITEIKLSGTNQNLWKG